MYLALGDREAAVQWIVKAADERSNAVAYFGIGEKIDSLRGDARVDAVLTRAGLDMVDPFGPRDE